MLNVAPAPVIFMHTDATDMRKSFTGLCGIIRGVFGDDPADGSLFLFVNKRCDRIKALRWEGDGFVIWYKRLEAVQRLKRYQRLVVIRTGNPKLACQGLRQEESKPIWERMREYIHGDAVQDVLPKDSFGQALTYLRNQFDPLLVYLDDGLMPIDNNETEQLMEQVAIGRKNSYDLLSTPRADVPYKVCAQHNHPWPPV